METTVNHQTGYGRALLRFGGPFLVLLGLVWYTSVPDGLLHLFFLDTPGDAVLLQTPRGRHVLIDGGEDPALLALHLGERLPFWKRTLEVVVLSQGDMARLPGQVAAIRRYRPEQALSSRQMLVTTAGQQQATAAPVLDAQAPQSAYMQEWLRVLQAGGTALAPVQPGSRLALDGVVLSVVAESSTTPPGLVLQIAYGTTTVVLAGASDTSTDAALLPTARAITALAYPWERPADTPLLHAWRPQVIIFTTAFESDPPALHTFAERAQYGAVYHPRLHGTVELVSDGRRAWVRTSP